MLSSSDLKAEAQRLGFELCGVAPPVPFPHADAYADWLQKGYGASMQYLSDHIELKSHPENLLPGVRSVIVVGLNYYQEPKRESGAPKLARYALGRDYHKVIRGKLKRLSTWVATQDRETVCRPCVDSAPIAERDFANLAGLGWFGKNTMLINSQRGSWFLLGVLLTTTEFEKDKPALGGCGTCTACVQSCPTGAIVFEDARWQVDARKCVSYLIIEHEGEIDASVTPGIGDWTFGCDVCQEVCPFNQPRTNQPLRAQLTREPDFLNIHVWPNLKRLAQVGETEWDEITRGSPVRRTGIEGLKRNARINLENQTNAGSTMGETTGA